VPVQAFAYKTLALHDQLHGNQQFAPGLQLGHVTPGPQLECFIQHFNRRFLSHKDNSCIGNKFSDSPGGFESIQSG
jgi:hypothetical protein